MDLTKIYYLSLENDVPFYVGKTINSLNKRLNQHKKIFGKDILIFLIEEIPTNEWKIREKFWIEQFKIWDFNLDNKNIGGGGSTRWTEEQKCNPLRKERLSEALKGKNIGKECWLKGKNHTESSKQKMSMSREGKKDTPETKKKKSESAKGKIKTQNHRTNLSQSASKSFGRKVLQKDLEGNIIKEWGTGKQASIELNLNYTAINNCCRNNAKNISRQRDKDKLGKYTSQSYIWEYK